MHLSRLTLTNLRQFDQRSFEFQPGFNLLVGENGAGKTTVLRGLLAALGAAQPTGRRPTLEDDDIRLHTRYAEVRAEIHSLNFRPEEFHFRKDLWERARRSRRRKHLPLVFLYASNEATCSAMKVKRAKRVRSFEKDEALRRRQEYLYEAEIEFARRPAEPDKRHFGNSQSVREFVGRMLSTFASDFSQFYWRFEPYDCSIVPAEGSKMKPLADIVQKHARAFALRYFQEDWPRRQKAPFEWPDQPRVVLGPESPKRGRDPRNLPDLREIWKGMKISSEGRTFLRSCFLEVKLTPRIMIRRQIGPLNLSQLSDGEQRLFSLFVDIARQLSLQNPQVGIGQGEAIVLIDEIDVHLHPKWQRKIVPALEDLFRSCQFIATTHSPFVIQAADRKKITSLDAKGSSSLLETGNSIEDIAETIQGVPIPQRSARAAALSDAAQRYFRLLKDGRDVSTRTLHEAESAYREASEPFTSEPAVHALLKVQLLEAGKQ